jgi:antitoxin ChpS
MGLAICVWAFGPLKNHERDIEQGGDVLQNTVEPAVARSDRQDIAQQSILIAGGADVILLYNFWEDAMYTAHLRKVGGSIMLAVPPAILETLALRPGTKVGLAVQGGRLVVEPQERPRYTLDELLAQCNPKARRSKEEREWLADIPRGDELI